METVSRIWPTFQDTLREHEAALTRRKLETVQVNLGKLCNQACLHCHVDAGPQKKRENLSLSAAERIVWLVKRSEGLKTIDLTGGAPELNPNFRYLVREFRSLGLEVIDRCNLTVLCEAGQETTAEFLAEHGVRIVASLPCYSRENVEKQRGDGVFMQSIQSLRRLNSLGFGKPRGELVLDLVYNPLGPSLPPAQEELEEVFKQKLQDDFGITFSNLLTITNMPIKRFLFDLKRSGGLDEYMVLLSESFNSGTLDHLMCRSMISVSWDGQIFDCDFNQMIGLHPPKSSLSIFDIESFSHFNMRSIAVADHCFGCTAGTGSSCGGSLKS